MIQRQRENHERLLSAKILENTEEINSKPLDMLLFNGLEPSADNKIGDDMLAEMWKVRADFAFKGLPANRTQLFHKHDWVWKN